MVSKTGDASERNSLNTLKSMLLEERRITSACGWSKGGAAYEGEAEEADIIPD